MTAAAGSLPTSLRWAVWLLAGEAAVVAAVTVLLGYEGITAEVTSRVSALSLSGFTALIAAALVGLSLALSRRKPRARAPALVLQLFGVVVAYFLVSSGLGWFSLPVAAVALSVITLLLTPATSAALAG